MPAGNDARFATLIEALRARLEQERQVALAGVDEIRSALDAYVEVVERRLVAGFLSRNGLAVEPDVPLPDEAARQLLAVVCKLPVLAASARSEASSVGADILEVPVPVPASALEATAESPEPPGEATAAASSAQGPMVEPAPMPEPALARRRVIAPLDDESVAFREEFESIDFDALKDADFLSYASEFAARARARQEQGLSPSHDIEGRIIRRLTALASARTLPRPVFGLSRAHKGDWAAIARRVRDEREGRVSVPDRPSGLTHRISIPAQVEVAAIADEASVHVEDEQGEIDAPLELPRLQAAAVDAEVVMVGGLVKREKLDRVRARTGIEVEWIGLAAGKSAAAVTALAKRIRAGRLAALVLLNGLMSHKESEPLVAAAREVGLPVAYADKAGKGSLVKAFVELEKRVGGSAA
jgi:hypothetical protein